MNDEKNILSPDEFKEDYENTLRPKSIDEFIGQADLKKNLKITIFDLRIKTELLKNLIGDELNNIDFIEGDITDFEGVLKATKDMDYILNLVI